MFCYGAPRRSGPAPGTGRTAIRLVPGELMQKVQRRFVTRLFQRQFELTFESIDSENALCHDISSDQPVDLSIVRLEAEKFPVL